MRKKIRCKAFVAAILVMLFLLALFHDVRAFGATSIKAPENANFTEPSFGSAVAVSDLLGTWTVNRVKVKKTVDGVSSEKTYLAGQKVEAFNESPKKVTFSADGNSVFEYENGKTDGPFEYTVEGNQIKRMIMVAVLTYDYKVTASGELQLVTTVSYTRDSHSIDEEYTYYGMKR